MPELPADIDHCCGMGQPGGLRWPVGGGYVYQIKASDVPPKGSCPACCYIRGWQDKERL